MTTFAAAPVTTVASRPRRWVRRAWLVLGPGGTLAAGFVALVVLAAVLAPWIAPHDPNLPAPLDAYAGPSGAHLLGTDALGRDLMSRLMYGARVALLASVSVIVLSSIVGTAIALLSAWAGGVVDAFISRVLDILFAIPGIIFALGAVSIAGPGVTGPVVGLTIGYTPYVARIVRGAALREVKLDYVSAAWVQGRSGLAICLRHLLPNLMPLIVAQGVSSLGFALIDLSSLSFLGLGVQPPTSDWGLTMRSGMDSIQRSQPGEAIAAALCIGLLVGSVIVLGDKLSKRSEERA
ncbi:glutathione ABC transporter permease GsiD [Nocardioides maradonensis]